MNPLRMNNGKINFLKKTFLFTLIDDPNYPYTPEDPSDPFAPEDCKCNEFGSKNLTCDCDGKCSCKLNIVGDTCDQCEIEHYDFPNCIGIFFF